MPRKTDLREAMLSTAKKPRPPSTRKELRPSSLEMAVREETGAPRGIAYQQPSRVGKKPVTGFFPPDVRKQLKLMTVEQDTTVQALMAEALNDLFAKYGKPEIAPTSEQA